jgi:hypothetical protein
MLSGNALTIITSLFGALISVPVGILVIRLYTEVLILLFRMNETLTDIKNALEKNQRAKS